MHNNTFFTAVQVGAYHTLRTEKSLVCRLLSVVGESTCLSDAFLLADDVLRQVIA